MKSINNLNTINALIKDEGMAHKEYHDLAMNPDTPAAMRSVLLKMSADELRHQNNLVHFKEMYSIGKK